MIERMKAKIIEIDEKLAELNKQYVEQNYYKNIPATTKALELVDIVVHIGELQAQREVITELLCEEE